MPANEPRRPRTSLLRTLGPGLVTGADDDDPSGIATYSQVGAQFGYALGWTMVFCFPLMAIIQGISAGIGGRHGTGAGAEFTAALSTVGRAIFGSIIARC